MWATTAEYQAELSQLCEDVVIEITELRDGMEETPYMLTEADAFGNVIDRHFYTFKEDAYQHRIAFREAESRRAEADRLGVHPLEIEFAPFGPAWQREQEGR